MEFVGSPQHHREKMEKLKQNFRFETGSFPSGEIKKVGDWS